MRLGMTRPGCLEELRQRTPDSGELSRPSPISTSGLRLLTRDPRRYRAYFPTVDIIAPET
jgi:hypothetical protein